MAYLAQFGTGDLDHCIANISAHNGLTLIGELFNGNIEIAYRPVMNFLRHFGKYYAQDEGFMRLLTPLADFLDSTGLAVPLVFALSQLTTKCRDQLFAELVPLCGQWPALWGFVPDEYYEGAKAFMFGADPKYADFIRLIDNFHYKAGPGMADKILEAANKKIKVSIVASYGFAPMPFTPKAGYETDCLIDTSRESSGATTAGIDRTFPADYRQKVKCGGHDHVSPDMRVDASTCLLPDQTWFVRDKVHFLGGVGGLINFLADSEKQPTVFDDPAYPQFATRLPDGRIVPTTP